MVGGAVVPWYGKYRWRSHRGRLGTAASTSWYHNIRRSVLAHGSAPSVLASGAGSSIRYLSTGQGVASA
eukprot:1082168-Rhodomonas_salina.2